MLDDDTLPDRRGSLKVDDEGCASQRNVLIENGILNRPHPGLDERPADGRQTRRQWPARELAHVPMPRMTNQLAGDKAREEIIGCLKRGLCTTTFGGGQVDITNGRFVFSASEAYWVENGKIQYPVKEATIIGNDLALDSCVGLCGKEGQGVPVGVGQPTQRVDGLAVVGTA